MTTCLGIRNRGVRVYPYPRVYPTRPVPAGMGRVRVDVLRVGSGTGTKSTSRVYPFLPVKNTIFHDVRAISNAFFISSFLANVNSRRPSVCLSSVCLSVCNVRSPYSGDEIFGNVSTPFNTMAIR